MYPSWTPKFLNVLMKNGSPASARMMARGSPPTPSEVMDMTFELM